MKKWSGYKDLLSKSRLTPPTSSISNMWNTKFEIVSTRGNFNLQTASEILHTIPKIIIV